MEEWVAARPGAGVRYEESLSARGMMAPVCPGVLLLDFGGDQRYDIRVGGLSISPQILFPRLGSM